MDSLRNLSRRKLRSSLTISGIVIGIFALTTMGAMACSARSSTAALRTTGRVSRWACPTGSWLHSFR